ncbi:MAG: ABC transporter substrate-binding protein [Clostridia bacterium]|nr:ABC transporter substrate-binding protein [Clostridia bacterium]
MKRFFCIVFVVILCIAYTISSHAEEIKFYHCIDQWDEGFKIFQKDHPDVTYARTREYYSNASVLAGKLITHELNSDILGLQLTEINVKEIIEKGYFLDLSDSNIISNAISQMVPAIAEAGMVDGKIYGLPYFVAFDYWSADADAWERAGLDVSQIPHSYPEFLDFVEAWCERIEEEPEADIRIDGEYEASLYDSSHYTLLFTGMLLDEYIMQKAFANEELSFNEEELTPLLERTKELGQRLYEAEPAIQVTDDGFGYSLFRRTTRPAWPTDSNLIVSMRMNEEQPQIIQTIVDVLTINSGTASPELCIELLERMAENPSRENKPFLYQNAEPVERKDYASSLETTKGHIQETEEKLKDPTLDDDEREELEESLSSYQNVLAHAEDDRYIVSPSQLADYQQNTSHLYVAVSGTLACGTDGFNNMTDLKKQFASGLLSTSEFLEQINRLARMIQLEE